MTSAAGPAAATAAAAARREATPAIIQAIKLHSALDLALERQVARVPGPRTPAQAYDDWASVLCRAEALAPVYLIFA